MSKLTGNIKSTSNFFYSLRGLAIISVAYAHCLSLSHENIQRLGAVIGLIGVPIFFLCSGLYFKKQHWDTLTKKIFYGIVLPWIIWGICNFCISLSLGNTNPTVRSLLAYILGYGTWLYYIPVYIILRIFYNKFDSNIFLLTSILISIGSNAIAYLYSGCYPPPFVGWLTPYQNPLNWAGFFAVGIIFSRYDFLNRLCILKLSKKLILIAFSSMIIILIVVIPLDINYWNPLAIILEYSIIPAIPVLGLICKTANSNFLIITGKNSYMIYLLHMQFGIAIANIIYRFIKLPDIVLLLVKPITVIGITLFIIFIIKWILKTIGLDRFEKYLGIHPDIIIPLKYAANSQ